MKKLKQELEKLSTTVDGLKEAINHNFNLLNIAIANIIEKANEEPKEYELIPFDIEKAKQGAKVMTRDGHDVRILCYDSKFRTQKAQPVVAEIYMDNAVLITTHAEDGTYYFSNIASDYDLMIAEECV